MANMTSHHVCILLLMVQGLLPFVFGNYLSTPELTWSIPIVSSTTDANDPNAVPIFQKGNAIVPLNDYGLLAITSSTGTLHIVSANDVVVANGTSGTVVTNTTGIRKSYTPTMISNNLDTITCQGGIIAAIKNTDGSFVVLYAITGTDSTAQFSPTSRVLAINTATTALVWNITIPGTIVGTPILSPQKNILYAVHNIVPTEQQVTSASSVGQVSIFQFNTESNVFAGISNRSPTLITTLPSTPTDRPFGPATITTYPKDGRDYLFFAESSDESFTATFSDSLFAITENDDNEFIFLLASSDISSTNTAPTIRNSNNEQLDFFLGQPESKLFGWYGDQGVALFDGLTNAENGTSSSTVAFPTWQIESSQDRDDQTTPIPNSPLLSSNGNILYVTAAGPQILAMDLDNRDLAWSATDLSSVVLSKPVYDHQQTSTSSSVPTSPVIYFMESENSILRQYNAVTGVSNWVAQCGTVISDTNDRPAECGSTVADFAVVANMLYYVDAEGNLLAMKVADFATKPVPTPAPIATPVTIPVAKPIAAPTKPTSKPVVPSTMSPTVATVVSNTPTVALGTNPPTGDEKTGGEISKDEKSAQSWFGENMLIAGVVAGAAVMFLLLLLGFCAYRKNQRNGKVVRIGLLEGKYTKDDLRNDETTVATTPFQSNDKSFEVQDIPATPTSPLTSIEEVEDEADQRSSNDIEQNLQSTNDEHGYENVVQNLLERFAVASFDMEDDVCIRGTDGDVLSPEHSSQLTNTMADAYSLASNKEVDDAASLTGTLSVASIGSTRSLKDTILSVLGMQGNNDADSLKSSKSSRSLQTQKLNQKSSIQRFEPVVSPIASPRPDYCEPGLIRPGQTNPLSPFLAPGSPTNSMLSNDESLYIDESTIASLEMPCSEDLLLKFHFDALTATGSVGELPSDCPEDEVTNKLQPGLVYLNRHQAKKEQLNQPIKSSLLDGTRRVQPMYNGVSVRPASRSRAGIFSRRQPKMSSIDDNTDDIVGIPEVTPEPIVLRTRRTLINPSSPVVDSQASHQSVAQSPPVRFTAAGYYIEEPEPEPDDSLLNDNSTVEGRSSISSETESQTEVANNQISRKKDTWNIFLNELSKVESQFFNPTAANKKDTDKKTEKRDIRVSPPTALANGRPPVAAALPLPPPDIVDGSESEDDEEAILPPPPAPRTFYA